MIDYSMLYHADEITFDKLWRLLATDEHYQNNDIVASYLKNYEEKCGHSIFSIPYGKCSYIHLLLLCWCGLDGLICYNPKTGVAMSGYVFAEEMNDLDIESQGNVVVRKEDFRSFLLNKGLPLPVFWFSNNTNTTDTDATHQSTQNHFEIETKDGDGLTRKKSPSEILAMHEREPDRWTLLALGKTFYDGDGDQNNENTLRSWTRRQLKKAQMERGGDGRK